MKKLVYVPLTVQQGKAVEDDLFIAFKKKFDAILFTSVEETIAFAPDIIHFHAGVLPVDMALELKKKTNGLLIQWAGDASYSPLFSVCMYANICNVTMLAAGDGQKEMYEKFLNHSVIHMPEAVAEWQIPEPIELNDGKIVFVGNMYDCFAGGGERYEMAEFLTLRYPTKFELYGSFPKEVNCKGQIPFKEVGSLYNKAYAVIALDNYWDIRNYFTHRYLGAMGTSCCVGKDFLGIENYFNNYEDMLYFRNKYELHDMIDFLYRNPEIRNAIAKTGRKKILENHTYDRWVDRYINVLGI